jgi:hypothetical protein
MLKEEMNLIRKNNIGNHITNMDKFSQPVLFDGVGKGQCRPTDYDCVIELDNKYWFAFEIKEKNKTMPYGQRLSYTRTADKWHQCGDVAYVFQVHHNVEDPSKAIMLKDCIMSEYYYQGEWHLAKNDLNVTQIIKILKDKYNITRI